MRSATLGEAWRRAGGDVVLEGVVSLDFVTSRLAHAGIPVVRPGTAAGDVLVVDSYDTRLRAAAAGVGGFGHRLLVDDLGGELPTGFDSVWNPNPYGHERLYPGFPGRVFAGPDWVPVRGDLPQWRGGSGLTVVSLGGGRIPGGLREAMTQLARLLPTAEFAMAGEWAPRGWRRIPRDDLWAAVVTAGRLITAAGTTVWEAAAVGVPVIVVQTADNQRHVYRWVRDASVPGLDATVTDAEYLAVQLRALLPVAAPLPPLTSGADRLAAALLATGKVAR
jgi:hypothetical protein